ncbi:response regulator transcription factor [Massilia sp. R2A-15]|uniref:response regulator transcription factor n=1 Tax=Massilia sp. R2A-15 TaxID=3064278 RepID=UPI00273242D7|nr:response regulator transcription factor [Massilia sp. R2A-15]WLI89167.1 response regulator transcription factor [Massilia sp. R2A-15]
MTQILIVEDNGEYAGDMAEFLVELNHDVTIATTAAEMWAALTKTPTAVVVLDLGLPDEDGFNVIPRMRQLYPEIGLLVLTGRVAFDNRILGLRLGADHYLTKPIKFPELAAHIEALDRRVRPQEAALPAPTKWTLRVSARQLELSGSVIDLTEKECNFLHLLTINTRPVPRQVIVAGMGGDDPDASRRVDMLVYRLRKKARSGLGQDLPLRSAYGEGYSLSAGFTLL